MILRLAQTVATKLHIDSLPEVPLCDDPLADWTIRLFKDGRVQWLMLVNTSALLSFLVPAKGVNTAEKMVSLLEVELDTYLMKTGFLDFLASQILRARPIICAKTLNRNVTGSVTDLVKLAQYHFFDGESAEKITARLQEVPMCSMNYVFPTEAFAILLQQSPLNSNR